MTIISALPFTLQNGTTADATQVMADFDEIVTDVNANAAHNGANNDITSLSGLTTPITPAAGGSNVFVAGTSTGSANAQVVATPVPTGFGLVRGNRVTFIAGFTNGGPLTLAVNGAPATAVKKPGPNGLIVLTGGEVVLGNYVEAVFDGTQFELYTDASTPGYGFFTGIVAASTTDLGSVPTHLVQITGSGNINSFGSSASTVYPIYKVLCQGTFTIVNSASLITTGQANITPAGGDSFEIYYAGGGVWEMLSYSPISGTAVINPTPLSGAQGLLIQNNSGTPNTNINIVADQVVMIKPSGNVPIYATSVSVTVNCTITGANGLDTGALAVSTWYNLFLISNGSTTSGLASLSLTPTLPSGYIYSVRVGAMRTDGSANFLRTRQQGSHAVYTPVTASNTTGPIQMTSGSNAAWTAIATGAFVPPTATQIKGVMSSISMGNNTTSSVAPNNNYPTASVGNSATTPWSITNSTGAANGLSANMVFEFNLEGANIYYASNAGSATVISAMGWTDKVNAN